MAKSIGILESIKKDIKEEKKLNSSEDKKIDILEVKKKRSYSLNDSTIKKLEEMKVFFYPTGTALEDIVDEAICQLYKMKKGE
ncbi:hypothetical protein KQI86_19290 [Clostridium sp. MSJ-11]|uniref:Uncharacterized protein n=1 Tax=Clostridium mobile TaxID=2841512 RepID=A0ABS6EMI8_9CLOT|nr:hypothetical protein [Clostridium mobile]MBU5486449.1 hypothetical protein [Clostridium mobile]